MQGSCRQEVVSQKACVALGTPAATHNNQTLPVAARVQDAYDVCQVEGSSREGFQALVSQRHDAC